MQNVFTDDQNTPQEFGLKEGSTVEITEVEGDSELYVSVTYDGVTEEYELNTSTGGPLLRPRVPR